MTAAVKAFIVAALQSAISALNALFTYVQTVPITAAPPVVTPPPPVVTPTPPVVTKPGFSIGTNFWFLGSWTGERPFIDRVNFAEAWAATSSPWNPLWLKELEGYSGPLRFMDWGCTNWTKEDAWAKRRLPGDPGNSTACITDGNDPSIPGMAYEWMIDLCNTARKDLWICLPAMADWDYQMQLATLVHARLHSSRRVFVEYSNETWNGAFSQNGYVMYTGITKGLPGANQWYKGAAYSLYRSLQLGQAFENIFGATEMGKRVIRVYAYSGPMDLGRQSLRVIVPSVEWNPGRQRPDMLAIAPYVGHEKEATPPADVMAIFRKDVDSLLTRDFDGIAFAQADQKAFGVPMLGCYEGGQTFKSGQDSFAKNPASYDAYSYMLNKFAQAFNGPFCHYTHTGASPPNSKGVVEHSWGARAYTGQPLTEAHKARAIADWIAGSKK